MPSWNTTKKRSGSGKYDPAGGSTTMTHRLNDGGQHSDTGYMRARTTVANTSVASVYTDITVAPVAGGNYEATVWVRSPSGTAVTGTLSLYGIWTTIEGGHTTFTADSTWKPIKVRLTPKATNNASFRLQIYVNTANVDLDIDTASLRRLPDDASNEAFKYDCNGSLIARTQTNTAASVTWTYTWDANRRLIASQRTSQNPTRDVYDASGQRVLRVDPDGSKTIYLGATELRWSPATPGTVKVARYYPGGTQRGFDGILTYAVAGRQGSVIASVNAATGAVTHNRYLPYGGLRGGTAVNDKGFLGQTYDTGSGLVYLNNRYQMGGFVSVDPLDVNRANETYAHATRVFFVMGTASVSIVPADPYWVPAP